LAGETELVGAVYKGFCEAKEVSAAQLVRGMTFNNMTVMIPWLSNLISCDRELLGDDWWPYGVGARTASRSTPIYDTITSRVCRNGGSRSRNSSSHLCWKPDYAFRSAAGDSSWKIIVRLPCRLFMSINDGKLDRHDRWNGLALCQR
jgi:hypothetical protein